MSRIIIIIIIIIIVLNLCGVCAYNLSRSLSGYWCREKLGKILKDPRVHSGCGYRMRKKAISKCKFKKRNEFSKHQWIVNRRYPKLPICQSCISSRSGNRLNKSRGYQNKSRINNNSPPPVTTAEDLDDMMDGYWARRAVRVETVEDLDNMMDNYWSRRAEA